ncbi:hypothetical protein [Rugamonas apoptosis]|uniref:Uncharacterized protein n=1 Tax=Rugamonas apoptosis TaxID=2758570 RepID=A0A7W2IJM9_9BURK|nr:hypothetical protein [Rugamonas apoptosis]MBA5686688.1 hypothetical protein [Rugamonas apoptosis]
MNRNSSVIKLVVDAVPRTCGDEPCREHKLVNDKIPAVFQMETVKVPCRDFLEFIRRSKAVFA